MYSCSFHLSLYIIIIILGMLVKPTEKYPHIFKGAMGDFFSQDGGYPYLLPSLVCATFNLLTALSILILLRETTRNPTPCCWGTVNINESGGSDLDGTQGGAHNDIEYEMLEMSSLHHDSVHKEQEEAIDDSMLIIDSSNDSKTQSRRYTLDKKDDMLNPTQLDNSRHTLLKADGVHVDYDENNGPYKTDEAAVTPLVYRRIVQLAVLSYGGLAFAQVIMDETLPLLFKESVANGGFSMGKASTS